MFIAALPIVELQYVDETGTKGALTVKYPIGTTYAVLDAQASALASFIAPLTGCALIRQKVIYKAVSSPRMVPSIGSTIVHSGIFIFEDALELSQVLIQVPGFLASKLVASEPGAGVLIDLTDSEVQDFITAFVASGMVNPFGVLCQTLIAAYRQSRS